jgi:hypothetical protein
VVEQCTYIINLKQQISDRHHRWGYEGVNLKVPGHALLLIADLINSIYKLPALSRFRSMSRDYPVTVEPFQFSSCQTGMAYKGSFQK